MQTLVQATTTYAVSESKQSGWLNHRMHTLVQATIVVLSGKVDAYPQVLSFALKPRALWVAAHHLELTGRMDGLWSALLNAVADLVSGNEAELDARRYKRDCLTLMLIHIAKHVHI